MILEGTFRKRFGVEAIRRPGFAAFLCIVEIVGRRIEILIVGCSGGLSSVSREVVSPGISHIVDIPVPVEVKVPHPDFAGHLRGIWKG